MFVAPLIDKYFNQVCIHEDLSEVSEWLKELSYLVVVNDDLKVEGIITLKDVHLHPYGEIIDCDIQKPVLHSSDTVPEALDLMVRSNTDFLPVFDNDSFVGVISWKTLAGRLVTLLNIEQANHL